MTPGLPALATLQAAPAWQHIDLLSDVHLHAGMPRTFEAWRAHLLGGTADAVLMLGDLFEVWVGDDARQGQFEAQCVAVLRQAAQQRWLGFMPGNRDFLVGDVLLAETGVHRLSDPTLLAAWGRRWLLCHGDELCLADADYQRFRQQVRSADWQRSFLAQPLHERQRQARSMRDASAAHQAAQPAIQWSDVDDSTAAHWLAQANAGAMIHGHTHRPGRHDLGHARSRHVLGDWDLDGPMPRARILRLSAQGLQSLDLGDPQISR